MTTTVTIEAHCGPHKAVEVSRAENNKTTVTTIFDGQSFTGYVYAERAITIREVTNVRPHIDLPSLV